MRFNEKLQILRKEKRLSQEQLADMLDVTRQSVSKWESGTTYPEMDKLIMLCKIFKCSLDDLTNDEISEIAVEKKTISSPFSLNNILDSFFGFIGKTVKMFQAMSFKDITKCIFSMFVLAVFLSIFYLPFGALQEGMETLSFQLGRNGWVLLLKGTFELILNVIFFALYAMVFVYVFKIAYLDKYEFVSSKRKDEDVQRIDEKKETIKEVKIVEQVPEPRDNMLLKVLGGIVLGFIKFLLGCFSLMIMFILVMLCFLLAIDVYLMLDGLVFIGVFMGIVFGIVLCAWFLEAISIFIFNRKIPFKRLLITFLVGLFGLGISFGICLVEIYDIDYVNEAPVVDGLEVETKKTVIPMTENLAFASFNMYAYNAYFDVDYVVDETMGNDISVEISYYPELVGLDLDVVDDVIRVHRYYVNDYSATKKLLKIIKKDLESKKLYNYDEFYYNKMVITSSQKNIDKIDKNTRDLYRKEQADYYNSMYSYEEKFDRYESIISDYQETIDELNEENESLKEKVEELENYKSRVQGVLGE